MLHVYHDDLYENKMDDTITNLQEILMNCYNGNCSEVIECDLNETANAIMNYYWEHAMDFLPDWWYKNLEIKKKVGINTFYIWVTTC